MFLTLSLFILFYDSFYLSCSSEAALLTSALLGKLSVCFADDINIYTIADRFYSPILHFQSHYLSLFNTRYAESFIIDGAFDEMKLPMLRVVPEIQGMSQL